jgi:nitrate/nitrite transport system ATP-binding protein
MITNNVEEALLLSDRIVPMTGRPPAGPATGRGTSLGAAVAVELPRPRSANDLAHDDCAARVRAKVVASLTEDLDRTRRGRNERAA